MQFFRLSENKILFCLVVAALAASGINPNDRLTWVLEVSWVIAGLPIVFLTKDKFPLTPLLKKLLFIHAIILIIGGYYTYERVPIGIWFKENFGLMRNNYDRLGHFMQGFVPAILTREIIIRKSPLESGSWLFLFVTSIALAFSAFFEMLEWWTSIALGEAGNAFLATQGDIWDTQWDMFLCLVGAIISQLIFNRIHDTQIAKIAK